MAKHVGIPPANAASYGTSSELCILKVINTSEIQTAQMKRVRPNMTTFYHRTRMFNGVSINYFSASIC